MTDREFKRLVLMLLIEIAKGLSVLVFQKNEKQSNRLDAIASKACIDTKEGF